MEKEMNSQDALNLVFQLLQRQPLTWSEHLAAQQALQSLQVALSSAPAATPSPPAPQAG